MSEIRIDAPALSNKQIKRVWTLIDKDNPFGPWGNCWRWKGKPDAYGYGQISVEENRKHRNIKSHRLVFFIVTGQWPTRILMHSCDTRLCVNPAHLSEGSNTENVADAVWKNRQAKGIGNGMAKLNEQQVIEIRDLYPSLSFAKIAKRYNVCYQLIHLIVRRKIWRHV